MKRFALAALLVLCGCATPYDPTPNLHDIADAKQVKADQDACILFASTFHRPFNTQGVAVSGAQGVGSNLGLGAQGLAGPLLGGIGGILTSLLQYFGVVDTDTPRAYQACLRQRLDRDHAAILVEPPL